MKISVIIPAFNEENHLEKNLRDIDKILGEISKSYEIIVVDDGSDDDTRLFLKTLKLNAPIKTYAKPQRMGKGAAVRSGLKLAMGDYIAIIDADLQIRPEEIKTFFKIMDLYDAEVVVGNKRHDFSNINYSVFRNMVSIGYHLLVNILFNLRIKDTQCGFKLFKRQAIDRIIGLTIINKFAFDLELLIALRENNIRVSDAPVCVRSAKTSSVDLIAVWETWIDTLRIWFRWKSGKYERI